MRFRAVPVSASLVEDTCGAHITSFVWLQLGNMITFVCSRTLLIHERLLQKK